MTTTGCAPGVTSSAGDSSRPSAGWTPSTWKKLPVAMTPGTSSAESPALRLAVIPPQPASPSNDRRAVPQRRVLRIREDAAGAAVHVDQPLGIGDRQMLEQRRVDEAEDRGVRADPERERQHRREREARLLRAACAPRSARPGRRRAAGGGAARLRPAWPACGPAAARASRRPACRARAARRAPGGRASASSRPSARSCS